MGDLVMPVLKLIKRIHNKYLEKKSEKKELLRGDIIGVSRILYDHYGVYAGDGTVIHYTLACEGWKLEIRKTGMDDFLHDSTTFFVLNFASGDRPVKSAPVKYRAFLRRITLFSPEETVRRAEGRIGEQEYNLLSNNCEHFAVWCKTGLNESYQVENFLKLVPRIKKRHVIPAQGGAY